MTRSLSALLLAACLPVFAGAAKVSVQTSHAIPLTFEENQGQAGPSIRFLSRVQGLTIAVRDAGVDFLPNDGSAAVRMRFLGANPHPRVEGTDLQQGRANYYIGNNPGAWHKGVRLYGQVRLNSIYPGVDLILYRGADGLEYDLEAGPGADLDRVQLRFEGARGVSTDAQGNLHIATKRGEMEQRRPDIYQQSAQGKTARAGEYRVGKDGVVRFSVPSYDPRQPLTIDPVVIYSTYFGGNGDDGPEGIVTDAAGDIYVGGRTTSTNLPTKPASSSNVFHGSAGSASGDAFVLELDPTGQTILSMSYFGGSGDDGAEGIALDASGNVILVGYTYSLDFPILNQIQTEKTSNGQFDNAFVLKVDPQANLVFSTYLGGTQTEACTYYSLDPETDADGGVVVDPQGNIYVGGYTAVTDFPVDNKNPGSGSCGDGYVMKISPAGKKLYSALIGGSNWDEAFAIAFDPKSTGAVYVAGDTISTDFPVKGTPFQSNFRGGTNTGDAWIARVDTTVTSLQGFITQATYYGGSSEDDLYGVALDPSGNVWIGGWTQSTNLPTQNALSSTFTPVPTTSDGNGFIAKFSPSLSQLQFGTYFGAPDDDWVEAIATDSSGNFWAGGGTGAPIDAAQTTPDALEPTPKSTGTGYLVKLDPSGKVLYFSYYGGSYGDYVEGMAVDGQGVVHVIGTTESTDFPVSAPLQAKFGGGRSDGSIMALNFATNTPVITSVDTSSGGTNIAQNTWIEIKGTKLSTTPTRIWTGSDFTSGNMPTQLDGVSATVNGKPAFVYYISSTQVNVLTPLDSTTGPVAVVLKNSLGASNTFIATLANVSPALIRLGGGNYVVAQHADGSLAGPASLSAPGYPITPAQVGETIVLYGFGFGLPAAALTNGAASQTGSLPTQPVFKINGIPAQVLFYGINGSPGLYQFNVTIPEGAASGDNSITVDYGGGSAPAGLLTSVAP